VDVEAQTGNMESRLQAVERMPSEGRGKPAQFIPIRFISSNKLTKDDRRLVVFDALVLSEVLGREVRLGKIIHGDDHATLKVKITSLLGTVRKLAGKMAALLVGSTPPDLVLNPHCPECEFRDRCRQKALEKDDLSLLSGMTAKERKKYHGKGIFTVTQLSDTFRRRRRPKQLRDRREKHQHSLRALAIREKKIIVVGNPDFKIAGTPVFLDVEGLQDRNFYYLIGLRVRTGECVSQHSLWADGSDGEKVIWTQFLDLIAGIANPVLIHYGSFEKAFLKRMSNRYGGYNEASATAKAIACTVNVLSVIYGHVYFPTYSNHLKDIASFLGARWEFADASGLKAIAWRHRWESNGEVAANRH
jgi:predicted RecB family nuclease